MWRKTGKALKGKGKKKGRGGKRRGKRTASKVKSDSGLGMDKDREL